MELFLLVGEGGFVGALEGVEPVPDGIELGVGVSLEEGFVEGAFLVHGVFRHDGGGGEALGPIHPGVEVVGAEAFAGQLQVWALAFEGLQGWSFPRGVAGGTGIAAEAGDLGTCFGELGIEFEVVLGGGHAGAVGDAFGEELRTAWEGGHSRGHPGAHFLDLAAEEGCGPVVAEFFPGEGNVGEFVLAGVAGPFAGWKYALRWGESGHWGGRDAHAPLESRGVGRSVFGAWP